MECSICCDEIVAATGQVTLGCSHQFHLGCVGRWLLKSSTCPMCRGETCAKEKILADDEMIEFEEDEEEEDDNDEQEEDDNDEQEEEIPEFDDAAHALWVMRKTFEMLDDGLSIASEPALAVFPDRGMFRYWKYDLDRGYESS